MGVYNAFPLPVVTYGILHRPLPGIARERYEGTIRDMHRGVEEESALFNQEQVKLFAGLSARQAQILRGTLSQFIATPIRSDNAEVQKIFQEAFEEHRAQVSEEGPYGAIVSWAGSAVTPADGPAWLKKLEGNGRRSRKVLGLEGPKGGAGVYESVFVVRGGLNLDVLEHIVRDRLGIYASAHGAHLGESAPFVVAAHNLIHSSGGDFWKSLSAAWGEAVLMFDKPAIPYDQFRSSVASLIDASLSRPGAMPATLWQRKLGLGRGGEFALRMLVPGIADVARAIEPLRRGNENLIARELFGSRASLLIKELFHPRAS